MNFADCGTSWTKVIEDGVLKIVRTDEFIKGAGKDYEITTGHFGRGLAKDYKNELIVLAKGAQNVIKDKNFTVVDVGARDVKMCVVENGEVIKLDWNQSCGALTGFTVELLTRYFNINDVVLTDNLQIIPLTCGVFGMEKVFDGIASGIAPRKSIAGFICGIADNTYRFAGKPNKLYLSGGMCENSCFIDYLNTKCLVVPLGRDLLVRGLIQLGNENKC